jgi:hypothetical protein
MGCDSNQGEVPLWVDEVGRLLSIHGSITSSGEFFIGVACDSAFAGGPLGSYQESPCARFPLVGLEQIPTLADAYQWVLEEDLNRRSVSVADAKANLHILGAIAFIETAGGSSHQKVKFRTGRSWPLDRNIDPIPDRFVGQLEGITGYPFLVVKSTLLNGCLPDRISRLSKFFC